MQHEAGLGSAMATTSSLERDNVILVLQGGGALGAYQAGVFEALSEHGFTPGWIAGISIGAINGAIIAGNRPENRIARLRAFWERVSSGLLGVPLSTFSVPSTFPACTRTGTRR